MLKFTWKRKRTNLESQQKTVRNKIHRNRKKKERKKDKIPLCNITPQRALFYFILESYKDWVCDLSYLLLLLELESRTQSHPWGGHYPLPFSAGRQSVHSHLAFVFRA